MTESSLVLAQATPPAASPQTGLFSTLTMMVAIFFIFYVILIRPQQKQLQEHKKLLGSLKKDDAVVTSSGIHGKIIDVDESILTVEIADKVKIRMNRDAVVTIKKAEIKSVPAKT